MATISYNTRGTCSRKIDIELEDGVIVAVKFHGGCSGNTQGVASLLVGMTADEAIRRLEVEDFPAIVIIDSLGNNLYETGRAEYLRGEGI